MSLVVAEIDVRISVHLAEYQHIADSPVRYLEMTPGHFFVWRGTSTFSSTKTSEPILLQGAVWLVRWISAPALRGARSAGQGRCSDQAVVAAG